MTSSPMVTRCPKCRTAFRITSTQLQSAAGAVRCGSCLHVFKAQDHLVDIAAVKQPAKPAEAQPLAASSATLATTAPTHKTTATRAESARNSASAATSTMTSAAANKPAAINKPAPINKPLLNKSALDDMDDILISDDMDDGDDSDGFDSYLDTAPAKPQSSLFDRNLSQELNHTPPDTTDESWAEVLIESETPEPQLRTTSTAAEAAAANTQLHNEHALQAAEDAILSDAANNTTAFAELTSNSANEYTGEYTRTTEEPPIAAGQTQAISQPGHGLVFSLIDEPAISDATDAATGNETGNQASTQHNAGDAMQLSDELGSIPNATSIAGALDQPSAATTQAPPLAPAAATSESSAFAAALFSDTASNESSDSARQVNTNPKQRSQENSRTALLMNIIPAPVEFTAKRMRRWYQRKLWPSLSLLALVLLVVQIAWIKFDYLNRIEPYRSLYSLACPLLGCQLQTLVDSRQISAHNLVVRANPDVANALLVDAIILNKAPFDQPFPDLVLAFTDLSSKPVASRRFTPQEYLGGELAGRKLMPRDQPVHLSLDIVDPGTNAVNYHLYIP